MNQRRTFSLLRRSTVLAANVIAVLAALCATIAVAGAEPQTNGWPLTTEERAYVLKPEHERRPGADEKRLAALWPVTSSAGFWASTSWLDTHAKLVDYVKANAGPIDVCCSSATASHSNGAARSTKAC